MISGNLSPGMMFRASDDPDRTAVPWNIKDSILGAKDVPTKVPIRVEDLLPPGESNDQQFAMMLHGVLSEDECKTVINLANEKGFTEALLNIGGGKQVYAPDSRKGQRCIVDCKILSNLLLERTRDYLPKVAGGVLRDVNERLRILCYSDKGDSFPAHCDGMYSRPYGHPHDGDCSVVTLQLYLNTIPTLEDGGGTALNMYKTTARPVAGSVLIFTQRNILHEGLPLKTDGIKYTLRSEYMYTFE
eukprot:TRINITY_DN1451_c4_g1_i1.p1 TRINITY_DN1451_c4_g1~~TRINITY_DN1451_c4_g1_i1.p1  ORF type:complete len:278 (+),score=44.17 TRINITY_DN1451_c4_g1_i1:100-834(+)